MNARERKRREWREGQRGAEGDREEDNVRAEEKNKDGEIIGKERTNERERKRARKEIENRQEKERESRREEHIFMS